MLRMDGKGELTEGVLGGGSGWRESYMSEGEMRGRVDV